MKIGLFMTKFAIQIENQFGYSWNQAKKIIEDTEKYDYHAFYVCDHFFLDNESANRNALESYTLLTAAAMITKKIKLGSLVTGNNYRNPALLAKIIASLDMISNGRVELGIGAGWKEIEYKAYGYEFPAVKDRMDMLEESLQIIKKLFTEESPSFSGKHYSLNNAHFSPRPSNVLFLVGGGGEKRTLKMVAKYADYCNLFGWDPTENILRKLEALKKHCEDIGRDYDDVGKSLFTPMRVFETTDELDNYLKETAQRRNESEEVIRNRLFDKNTPGAWFGTPEMLRDRIEYFNSLGFDYYHFQQPIDLSNIHISRFSELVMNKFFK